MDIRYTIKDSFYHHTAVITGASRGLGLEISSLLWRAGANVVLVARSQEKLQEICADFLLKRVHPAQTVEIITTDLSSPIAVKNLIDHLTTLKVDIVINNAAVHGPIGPCWENDWKEWQRTLQVNLLAPIEFCRALVPQMIERQKGKIINLSGGGAANPRANFSAYTVAKAGLVRFSETLAEEIKATGICVNCIAPGMMNTELLKEVILAGAQKAGQKEYFNALKNSTSTDHAVIQRAAELCMLLASKEGDGITGKLISAVWDPWRELTQYRDELMNSDIYTLRRIVPEDRGQKWDENS